jgi:hypothetical protein
MSSQSFQSDDPLLDAFLEELAGKRKPPNLTARILRAWALERNGAASAGDALPDSPVVPQYLEDAASPFPAPRLSAADKAAAAAKKNGTPLAQPKRPTPSTGGQATGRQGLSSRWRLAALAASFIGLGLFIAAPALVTAVRDRCQAERKAGSEAHGGRSPDRSGRQQGRRSRFDRPRLAGFGAVGASAKFSTCAPDYAGTP